MALNEKVYLGVALKLPIQLVNGAGTLAVGRVAVEQSIQSILTSPIGSRFFLPEYGSRLEELVFEPNDAVLKNMLRLFVFEALGKWEKRAKFTDIDFAITDDKVECIIYYRILPSNEINSYVFPFYRELIY